MTAMNATAAEPLPTLYTIPDLSRSFRVAEVTIRRMIRRGELQPLRIGGQLRFTKDEVEKMMRLDVPAT